MIQDKKKDINFFLSASDEVRNDFPDALSVFNNQNAKYSKLRFLILQETNLVEFDLMLLIHESLISLQSTKHQKDTGTLSFNIVSTDYTKNELERAAQISDRFYYARINSGENILRSWQKN